MIRVGVSGAAGRMGRLVAGAVAAADDMELAGLYGPGHDSEEIAGMAVSGTPDSLANAEVVVEVTRPDVVMDNLARWRQNGAHAVVGTSGFARARLDELKRMWGSGPPNCLVVPNFSIGAVLMMRFAAEAAHHFEGAEIVEMHHADKVDAPSGTAIATAEAMGGDVPIHSVRLPGLVAHQAVILGAEGQTLTIRHDT
ncbi:MAG: dihydrodipicolinate reductase C-terminal domain-containing protein, partial [Acidimicrobiia bacterium]|nr:dihydrodipicolinate reductase C-terminal domain-containing protein [Acidimicrobiia bacterium]